MLSLVKGSLKDLNDLKDKKIKNKVADIIEECKSAKTMNGIRNLKKLEGFDRYYRIRVRDFRMGIEFTGQVLRFLRIANRKDIYKIFP